MSLSVIFSNTYTANAAILNDAGVFTTSFPGNGLYVREATMHIERNGTPTNVAYIMQILDTNNNVLATSQPYSIQDLINEFGPTNTRGEPRFIFDGTLQVTSGTTYKLAIRRNPSSGSGSSIYVHYGSPSDFYCIIWGSSGGGGGSWNGGTITTPIELMQNFTTVNGEQELQKLLYEEWLNQPPDIPNPPVGYMLRDNTTQNFNRIFGILIKNPANPGSAGSPAVGLTHHLIVRGDYQVRGMIDSKEGVFVAHGGPKLIGWGPEGYGNLPNAKRNPMLLIKDDGWPDNVAPNTWETRIMSPTGVYSWASFETNHLTTKGKVMCDDIVHTNAIGVRTAGATKIEFYNSIMPHPNAQTNNSGSISQYWLNTYGGNVYGKQAFTFNCAREDSGKEVLPNFNTEEQALKFLMHETKKTVLHTTYSSTAEDEIICTCGKSVKQPCPEHLDEWNDRYARNETKRLDAASLLVLEHSNNLTKLSNALEEANKKIRLLEQKLEKMEK
jgi:hypothetical protein